MKATALLLPWLIGCGGGGFGLMVGSGRLVSASRDVGAFSAVDFSNALAGEVVMGDGPSVSVKVDDNLLDFIHAEVAGDELRLYVTPGIIIEPSDVFITVHVPELRALEASGASRVTLAAAKCESLTIKASGASEIAGSNVDSTTLQVEASGASKITLRGKTGNIDAEVSGASHLAASELQATIATVDLSGASQATIAPVESLSGDLSGASVLTLATQPATRPSLDISGASSVNYP